MAKKLPPRGVTLGLQQLVHDFVIYYLLSQLLNPALLTFQSSWICIDYELKVNFRNALHKHFWTISCHA